MNKFDITCVTPEFPYCPLCPYGLVEPDDAEWKKVNKKDEKEDEE